MNLIFPLDILFVIFGLAANIVAIGGALLRPSVQVTIFEAMMQTASAVFFF